MSARNAGILAFLAFSALRAAPVPIEGTVFVGSDYPSALAYADVNLSGSNEETSVSISAWGMPLVPGMSLRGNRVVGRATIGNKESSLFSFALDDSLILLDYQTLEVMASVPITGYVSWSGRTYYGFDWTQSGDVVATPEPATLQLSAVFLTVLISSAGIARSRRRLTGTDMPPPVARLGRPMRI